MREIREEDKISQIDILTNLTGDFFPDEPQGEYEEGYALDSGEPLDGWDLAPFESKIFEMVQKSDHGHPCDFMDYFDGADSIKEKIESAVVSVKNIDGILYGCTSIQMRESLEGAELQELCEYITGQYADGWGEAFKQSEFPVDGGSLRIHFYQIQDFHLQERANKADALSDTCVPVRPKLKLLGHDGNIFSILGDARRLLFENGQGKEAEEMTQRVENSGDYYRALGIISEYVETELSVPPDKNEKAAKKPKERGESR